MKSQLSTKSNQKGLAETTKGSEGCSSPFSDVPPCPTTNSAPPWAHVDVKATTPQRTTSTNGPAPVGSRFPVLLQPPLPIVEVQ